jgi:hypothetical protein
MSVTLLRNYATYLSGAVVTLPDDVESALIAQGLATAAGTSVMTPNTLDSNSQLNIGGNLQAVPSSGFAADTNLQGPSYWPNIPMGAAALTGFETNGVVQTAGSFNIGEIYVPFDQTWTGAGVLNGTVVGTDSFIVALYGSDGTLLANSAVAGTLSAGASVFQDIAFTSTIKLPAGRYFLGLQSDGTTATIRHILAANGASPLTSIVAGTFGTVPSSITVPTTFTTAQAPIMRLYA